MRDPVSTPDVSGSKSCGAGGPAGRDGMSGGSQGINDQAGWSFDGDRQSGWRRDALAPGRHVGQPGGIVRRLDAQDDLAGVDDEADGVSCAAPIQSSGTWHVLISLGCDRLTRAGRSCGSLTDMRSGWRALAHRPLVCLDLPAPAARRSEASFGPCGPSSGKPTWRSRPMLGLPGTTLQRCSASDSAKVHR